MKINEQPMRLTENQRKSMTNLCKVESLRKLTTINEHLQQFKKLFEHREAACVADHPKIVRYVMSTNTLAFLSGYWAIRLYLCHVTFVLKKLEARKL